ncbi:hypothetical protein [Pararhodobacter sp.]|uniref:tellurite resistance TerB family protein n=1 Tax=Pararhodobacter sp. TaxID=2127056 RepID=UPI002B001C3B|nr:hypothetical protein [Pararhodobacter sp.]
MPHRLSEALADKERHAPASDADEMTAIVLPEDEAIIGGLYGIEYRDSRGGISTRDIIVRAVEWNGTKLQVGAHCLLRNTYRSFIAQNIVTLANGRTGEIIKNPTKFFSGLTCQPGTFVIPGATAETSLTVTFEIEMPGRRPPRKPGPRFAQPKPLNIPRMRKDLRDTVRPAAILMMAVAHADGRLCENEVRLIGDLVWEGARKTYTIYQTEMPLEMAEELTALKPSSNMITRALNLTLERGAFPADLPAWLTRMARADGAVVDGEKEAMTQILTTLRRLTAERKKI